MTRSGRRAAHALASIAVLATLATGSAAQDDIEVRRTETASQLDAIKRDISLSGERLRALENEVAAIRKDRAALVDALVAAAAEENRLAREAAALEDRLVRLGAEADVIRTSLAGKRAVLAQVLAGLQRMGLNPPPAILVRPDDALASVRSAILLGAVVPEMRDQTAALVADLDELARISAAIGRDREELIATLTARAAERERLSLLVEEKRSLEGRAEEQARAERAKAAELAGTADNLRGLIRSMEAEIASARAAAEAAEEARRAEEKRIAEGRARAQAPADSRRVAPAEPYGALRGRLPLPVAGRIVTAFGSDDGVGGKVQGNVVETRAGALVTTPSDGWVLYAGPFRSYGQLLILNAGDGYHVVMAGMDRIYAELGQFVLAGEPVGEMGGVRVASVAPARDNGSPTLYVEFRKNGIPVDPAPWWAKEVSGRIQDDS